MEQKTGSVDYKRPLPSIRTKLALLVLACLVPTVVGFALLINHFYQRELAQLRQDNLLTARALVHAVDRDLNSGKIAALSLANSHNIASNDLAAFHAEAKRLLGADFPGFTFVLSDQSGQQIVNTLRPFGQPLPRHGNPDQLRRVFETGRPVISAVYIGGVMRRPLVAIEVPVWRDGKVRYSLAVGFLPERLGQILTEQQLPANRIVAIFDARGVIVARTHEPEKYVGQTGAPMLLDRMRITNEGEAKVTSVEGIPIYAYFSRSLVSGWTVAIGVTQNTVRAELLHSIAWVGLAVAVILFCGFALAWYIGGSISRSVKALASPAIALNVDQRAQLIPMSFKEADEVATELSIHRHNLERLVSERTEQLNRSNARLAESERLNRAVTDNLPGLVAYWDAELRCRFANKQYIEWFNKTPEEMIGTHLRDLLGANLYAQNEPYLRRALLGEQQNFERTLTKASGEIRYTWASYIPDFDANGIVVGIFVLVSDVTELKQAQEEQRIAATAFDSQEAMMITDANAVILRVNRAFTEVTGYAFNEIVGQTPRVLQSNRHAAAFYKTMWDSIHRCGSWKGEIWDRYKNGKIAPNWMTITAVKDTEGIVTHYVCTLTDITLRKAAEEEIKQLAFFDALTGLPNRRLLMDRLGQTMAATARTEREGALMFIDLDNFKIINDTLGHDKGDLLLQDVAKRLVACVREGDTVARLGGDEFVVVLGELSEKMDEARRQAQSVGEKILASLNQRYDLAGREVFSTPSIGVTLFSDHKNSIPELLKHADLAMYQAKTAGRNRLCFFEQEA